MTKHNMIEKIRKIEDITHREFFDYKNISQFDLMNLKKIEILKVLRDAEWAYDGHCTFNYIMSDPDTEIDFE